MLNKVITGEYNQHNPECGQLYTTRFHQINYKENQGRESLQIKRTKRNIN